MGSDTQTDTQSHLTFALLDVMLKMLYLVWNVKSYNMYVFYNSEFAVVYNSSECTATHTAEFNSSECIIVYNIHF